MLHSSRTAGLRLRTTLRRFFNGRNLAGRDSQVFLPMITALIQLGLVVVHVRLRKRSMSAGRCHGSFPCRPMPREPAVAATMTMKGRMRRDRDRWKLRRRNEATVKKLGLRGDEEACGPLLDSDMKQPCITTTDKQQQSQGRRFEYKKIGSCCSLMMEPLSFRTGLAFPRIWSQRFRSIDIAFFIITMMMVGRVEPKQWNGLQLLTSLLPPKPFANSPTYLPTFLPTTVFLTHGASGLFARLPLFYRTLIKKLGPDYTLHSQNSAISDYLMTHPLFPPPPGPLSKPSTN